MQMIRKGTVLAALIAAALTLMSEPVVAATVPSAAAMPPNLFDAQRQVEDYLSSGRYDADFAKALAPAFAWLEDRAKTAFRPAIVLDIDETSLSNWPAYRINGWGRVVNGGCDLRKGPCGIRAWQASGHAKALPATLALARRARELGVAVFFISARPSNLRRATERNLKAQGYEWTELVILPADAKFSSAADFKAPERSKIARRGYTIILNVGDQESDLKGGYAEKTVKLPNPVYHLP